jgi:hypothetical protein
MRALERGQRLRVSVRLSATRLGVIGATLLFAGCASTHERRYAGAYQPPPQPVAERGWTTEIEEDGKPAQVPPVRRMRPEEDDPTQPWSPNYGSRESVPPVAAPPTAPRPSWPRPIQTQADPWSVPAMPGRRLSEAEAEAVMARAITAHERRLP